MAPAAISSRAACTFHFVVCVNGGAGGEHQRRPAPFVCGIHLRTGIQQTAQEGGATGLCRQREGGAAFIVSGVHIGTGGKQHGQRILMTVDCGNHERCSAIRIGRVRLRTCRQHGAQDGGVAAGCRCHQRRVAVFVCVVDVCACFHETVKDRFMPVSGGAHKGAVAVCIDRMNIRTGSQERLHGLLVPVFGSEHECGGAFRCEREGKLEIFFQPLQNLGGNQPCFNGVCALFEQGRKELRCVFIFLLPLAVKRFLALAAGVDIRAGGNQPFDFLDIAVFGGFA